MNRKSDNGFATQLGLFMSLIAHLENYEGGYQPGNPALHLEALKEKLSMAENALNDTHHAMGEYQYAIQQRDDAFNRLNDYAGRLYYNFVSNNAPTGILAILWSFVKKIKGYVNKRQNELVPEEECGAEKKQRKKRQLSFVARTDNFSKMVGLLEQYEYIAYEAELSVAGARQSLKYLRQRNLDVAECSAALAKARLQRDIVFYDPDNGLIAIAKLAKNYMQARMSRRSETYKQFAALRFRGRKVKVSGSTFNIKTETQDNNIEEMQNFVSQPQDIAFTDTVETQNIASQRDGYDQKLKVNGPKPDTKITLVAGMIEKVNHTELKLLEAARAIIGEGAENKHEFVVDEGVDEVYLSG